MKKIFLVLLVCSIQVFSQNYFPLHMGNSYQYLVSYSHWFPSLGEYRSKATENITITRDTVVNNLHYYYLLNNFMRYDSLTKKVYILCNSQDTFLIDLSGTSQFNTNTCFINSQYPSGILQNNFTLFGNNVPAIGLYGGDGNTNNNYYWAPGYGIVSNEIHYVDGSTTFNKLLNEAIVFNNGSFIHSKYNYAPSFTVKNQRIQNGIFNLMLYISHPLSDTMLTYKFDYIDTTYLAGYYKKNNDIVPLDTLIFSNIDALLYNINVPLDTSMLNSGYIFYYKAIAKDKGLIPVYASYPDTGFCNINTTSVGKETQLISNYILSQNYPNPFNPSTTIRFTVPSESNVNITVYNSLGSMVKELVKERKSTGDYEVKFDGAGLASGVYFVTLKAASADGKDSFVQTKKMILMK